MRRLVLVLISLLVGVQGCTRSGDTPPVVAGEQVVAGSGTGVLPPPSGSQTGYSVAFDGTNYLVAWSDVRGATGADVYAARLSPSGALVDGALITVTAAAGDQLLPEVAFDGTNYLVVWQNGLSGDRNVQGARVSRAGAVLDTTPITIAQSERKVNPVVAFDGTNYLVVWEDQHLESSDIYGARVSPAGAVVTAAFPISAAAGQQVQPALACVVGTCLATWRDGRNGGPDVYGARIGATAVLDPAGIAISRASSSQGAPTVAGDGTRFLVAWGDSRNGTADVYGARVDAGGNVLDPSGAPISLAPGAQQAAAIAFEGRWFVVVWEDYRSGTGYDVYGARVGADAAVLDPGGFVVEPGTVGARVAIASDGAGRSLVASDRRQVVDPILGTAVSRLSARILISRATLTVSRAGTGSGTVTSTPAGIDCGTICSAFFDAPTDVNLTPTAAPGSAFVSWAGACSGPGACTVTVNDTRAVTATFSPTHVLTVARSGTAGTVVSSPAGIDCGTSCSAEYVEGTFVDLTPTPGTNSLFASWSAPCDVAPAIYDPLYLTTSPTCRVPITQARTVTASFTAGFKLTVNATGTASGRVDAQTYWPIHCATGSTAGCSSMVLANTPVTLVATPAANAILKSWSGCTSSSALECAVSLTAAKTVTATFQPSTYLLTVVATGTGTGTVTGTGIACATGSGGDCTEPVGNGDTVTLTAAPGPDSILKTWSGCLTYSGTSCTVTMTGAKKVTATFQPSTFPLTLNSTGGGGGTVSSETPGFTCTVLSGVPCTGTFANGETVVFTASPDATSVFKSWSGCTMYDGAACTVTMTGPKTLTLKMEPSTYPLNVAFTGSGTVTGPGIACSAATPEGCSTTAANGDTVTLTAAPAADWIVKSWSGCASYAGATCTVTMTGAKTVTANFEPSTYALTVATAGTGVGTVTGAGIACTSGSAAGCTAPVANGDTVTLTATPDASSIFKGWSGCSTYEGTSCTVSMTAAKRVTVTFQPATYLLTTVATGTGTATGTVTGTGIACTTGSGGDCTEPVANGDTVTLTAAPGPDSILKTWSGCLTYSGTSCTVTMTGAKTVTATFQPSTYPLTLNSTGGGGGTVSSETAGFTCTVLSGVPCTGTFANGETVVFTASPDATSVFKSWSGCTMYDGPVCTVIMSAARTLTLKMEPSTYPLTAAFTGSGTVTGPGIACSAATPGGCSTTAANGDTVTLTAAPDAGWIVKSWSGCASYAGATCTVTMTGAKTVTANFEPSTYALTVATAGTGVGTVTGAGIACTSGSAAGCAAPVANGDTVTLTATPDGSSIFKSWSGCSTYAGTSCTVSMTAAKSVTATFQPSTYLLTTVATGTGTGTVTGPGIACATASGGDCSELLANGDTVTLTAAPGADSILKTWSGCLTYSGTSCTVTMTGAKTVTATFQPSTYALTVVTAGTGGGTVAGGEIACTSGSQVGCTTAIGNGEWATLTATPDGTSLFKGWSGCTTIDGATCNVWMIGAKTVTATFQPTTYLLTVTISGAGSVSGGGILCSAGSAEGCSAAVANGDAVTLTATAAEGALFRGWTGCSIASGTSCTVNMTAPRGVTAFF